MLTRVLDEVEPERRLGVLLRVEAAQHEQVGGEAEQPEREGGQGVGGGAGVGGVEGTPLERGDDERPGQDEVADRGRDDEQPEQPDAERDAVVEGRAGRRGARPGPGRA